MVAADLFALSTSFSLDFCSVGFVYFLDKMCMSIINLNMLIIVSQTVKSAIHINLGIGWD